MIEKNSKIFVAGHEGMLGAAIYKELVEAGYSNLIVQSRGELDLRDQSAVKHFFEVEKPDYVFLAASRDGGILANEIHRSEFIYDNILIQANVIHQCYHTDVKKLFLFSSSAVYPKNVQQLIKETSLLKGELDTAYEFYAISKIAGIKMCQAYNQQFDCKFVCIIHDDLYGAYDQYDRLEAHVVPALTRRIYEAKIKNADAVEVWGTGSAMRSFLHVDDLAKACVFLLDRDDCPEIINVGNDESVTIQQLSDFIKLHMGYTGHLYFNPAKPDTMEVRTLDTSVINSMGWYPKIKLLPGLKKVLHEYEKNQQGSLTKNVTG